MIMRLKCRLSAIILRIFTSIPCDAFRNYSVFIHGPSKIFII
uniref:Uncharacterized protein n=1 Tax=Anguilla anguilla TaxID=7936 RepID=A0A0E9UEB9_ANGAN